MQLFTVGAEKKKLEEVCTADSLNNFFTRRFCFNFHAVSSGPTQATWTNAFQSCLSAGSKPFFSQSKKCYHETIGRHT